MFTSVSVISVFLKLQGVGLVIPKPSWYLWDPKFKTFYLHLGVTLKRFIPVITLVCGMEGLHMFKRIIRYSKRYKYFVKKKKKCFSQLFFEQPYAINENYISRWENLCEEYLKRINSLEFVSGGSPMSYISFCLKDFLGMGLIPNFQLGGEYIKVSFNEIF